jgi:multiple sugar transport system substrate-binding protein
MGAEGEYINQLVPLFVRQNPDIDLHVQAIPWTAAHEKLLTAFAGNCTPDVCQMGNTWIPEFYAIGALQPLNSFLENSQNIKKENYFDGIWNTNIIGQSAYGIPWYVDTRLLFYRSDILSQAGYARPPHTWQEWLDVSRKIKKTTGQFAIFMPLGPYDWQIPVMLMLENGAMLLKQNNSLAAFADPLVIEAMDFYVTFFREGLAPRNMSEVNNVFEGFSSGFFSMMITGPWNVNEMRRRAPELAGKWSTCPMPVNKKGLSVAGGSSLVIFQGTSHPREAWRFVEFMSMASTQIEFFRLTRDLPAVRQAWEMAEIKNDPEIRAFYRQLEMVSETPKIAEWEQIAVKVQEHLEQVVFDQKTLAEAMAALDTSVDRILEKRRWLLSRGLLQY